MLKLDKHTNPSLSVVNVAGLIIDRLRKNGDTHYNELLEALKESASESVKEVYLYALSFLFLVGRIEYISENDTFKLKR